MQLALSRESFQPCPALCAKESERGVWSSRCFMVQLLRWQSPEDKHWKGGVPGYKGGDCGEDSWGHGGVRKASQNKQNQTFSWEKQGERERGVRSSKRRGPGMSMLAGGPARWPWQEFPGNPKWLDWALTLGFDDLRNSNNCVQFNSVTQSCPNLCNPMDCSTPGFPYIANSRSLLKLTTIESVMPSNYLILCCPLLLLLSIFPSIRVFSKKSAVHIRWPKCRSFSFSISPCNEYSGLISFRMDWLDLLAVQGTLQSLLQHTVHQITLPLIFSKNDSMYSARTKLSHTHKACQSETSSAKGENSVDMSSLVSCSTHVNLPAAVPHRSNQ